MPELIIAFALGTPCDSWRHQHKPCRRLAGLCERAHRWRNRRQETNHVDVDPRSASGEPGAADRRLRPERRWRRDRRGRRELAGRAGLRGLGQRRARGHRRPHCGAGPEGHGALPLGRQPDRAGQRLDDACRRTRAFTGARSAGHRRLERWRGRGGVSANAVRRGRHDADGNLRGRGSRTALSPRPRDRGRHAAGSRRQALGRGAGGAICLRGQGRAGGCLGDLVRAVHPGAAEAA